MYSMISGDDIPCNKPMCTFTEISLILSVITEKKLLISFSVVRCKVLFCCGSITKLHILLVKRGLHALDNLGFLVTLYLEL